MVKRYRKVLKYYRLGHKLSACCARAGYNELTIRSQATIGEMAIAAPEAFAAMQKDMKLTELAENCRLAINDNLTIQAKIKAMKEKRELIPYKKK